MKPPEPPVSKAMAFCLLIGLVGTFVTVLAGVCGVVVYVFN